jgi:hypothetical protein
MLYALKVAGVVACFVVLVPLMVWGGTGDWRHALHALREYAEAMAVLIVPVLVLAALVTLWEFMAR